MRPATGLVPPAAVQAAAVQAAAVQAAAVQGQGFRECPLQQRQHCQPRPKQK